MSDPHATNPPAQRFYPSEQFPFTAPLAAHWQEIRDEYLAARELLVDWEERKLYDEGWQVLALYRFPHGEPVAENIRRCPRTSKLVATWFPTHAAAGFSVLQAGAEIRPHQGYQGEFLRCHLGLVVPPGDVALRVEDEQRPWLPGGVLVFDDRLWHEAWNRTAHERAVLLVDFIPQVTQGDDARSV